MSVLIRGMEMPTNCEDCPLGDSLHCQVLPSVPALWAEYTNAIREKRLHSDCPLTPVPPHGDLIERDALTRAQGFRDYKYENGRMYVEVGEVVSLIKAAPTIIPAEEEPNGRA